MKTIKPKSKPPVKPKPKANKSEMKSTDGKKMKSTDGMINKPFGNSIVRLRKGATEPYDAKDYVWREEGKAGADLDRPPSAVWCENQLKAYKADGNKVARTLNLIVNRKKGVATRKARAELIKAKVVRLSVSLAPKQIGYELKITPRRVNQILAENLKSRKKGND